MTAQGFRSHAPAQTIDAAQSQDAVPYSHRLLSTPWPWYGVGFGGAMAAFIVLFWTFDRHYDVGDKLLLTGMMLLLLALDLFPAVWTLRHRAEAHRYVTASSRNWYRSGLRHPWYTVLGTPVLGFVYGFGRGLSHHGHASLASRFAMGGLGAVVVGLIGVFRVVHAKKVLAQQPPTLSTTGPQR